MNVSNSSSISKANSSIMEYLYQKMEAKSKTISQSKQLINNIYDVQSLQANKRGLLSFFSELEDDLKQAAFAIKGLLADNKALTFDLNQLHQKQLVSEENSVKYINELTSRHNILQAENEELKEQLFLMTNPCNNNMNINPNEDDNQLGDIAEENKVNTQSHKKPKTNSRGCSLKTNEDGLKNVGNIISDMKSNKKKLKDMVNNHFNSHQSDNNKLNHQKNKRETSSNNDNKNECNIKKKSSDILMRVMSSQENINVLNEKMGNDFMKKMLSKDCTEEYLTQIENIINETEEPIREKLPIRIRSCKSKSKSKDRIIKRNEQRSLSNSFINASTPLYPSKVIRPNTSFETSLRDYPKRSGNRSKPKFNHYLNPYGKYFANPNEQTTNIKPISS